MDSVLIDAI